jgi:uncharacterized Zn finger protein (UPF0148 family)
MASQRARYVQPGDDIIDDTPVQNTGALVAVVPPRHYLFESTTGGKVGGSRASACESEADGDEDTAFSYGENFAENLVCAQCNLPLILVNHESHVSCPMCGETVEHFDATSAFMAYGDGVDFPSFNYKRSGHLDERLGQMQGRERKIVPDAELERIMRECRRRNLRAQDITRPKLLEVLKYLDMRGYYKHTTQLLSRITGRAPPRMTPEQEEVCRRMFMAMQAPFEKYKPTNRRNFLSYAYAMYVTL